MEDIYVARQPIFDRKKNVFAYELLFRDGTGNICPDMDGDEATTALVSNTLFTLGLDTMSGGKKAFINFTQKLLEDRLPQLLPKETTVVEILEDVSPEPLLIAACRDLSKSGYTLALDDFIYSRALDPLIMLADIIKFDFILTPFNKIEHYLEKIPKKKITLLAEKIETPETYEQAFGKGFNLFQGYFFKKPETIKGTDISGAQINVMKVLAEINKPEFDINELENLISRDMGISFKLLKYINSVFFARVNKVSSIQQALVYLGERETKRFVSLIALSKLGNKKPDELMRASCIRGKFCELLAGKTTHSKVSPDLFTLGMFSMVDAVIDQPMGKIMQSLPLSQNIKSALVEGKGEFYDYIRLTISYEAGQWEAVSRLAVRLGIDEKDIPRLYFNACKWTDAASKMV